MIYLALFVISFILTYFIKGYAIKKSLLATVNERSSHSVPTPHGGGIAIAITWYLGLTYLFFNDMIAIELFYALLAGIIISMISFVDDIYELSAKLRLVVQSCVAIIGIYLLGGLDNIYLGFFTIDNSILVNMFAFFIVVWYINLTNFMDGINGYVGSEFVFLSLAGLLLFSDAHFGILAVSVLGFLYWNWNKAKIFMGDVGSTLLGYNIAIFTIYYANLDGINLWIWIVLFSVFWFDATLTLIRRKLNKERLSQAHKKHVYQRLTQSGWSHFKVTNYSIVINFIILLMVLLIPNIAISLFLIFLMLSFITLYIERGKAFS